MIFKLLIADERLFDADCSKIGKRELTAIFDKLEELKTQGTLHAQAKRLKNYPVADFRLRIGSYRVLFDCDLAKWEIVLFRVLHRSKLY